MTGRYIKIAHVGAGRHSYKDECKLKKLLRKSLSGKIDNEKISEITNKVGDKSIICNDDIGLMNQLIELSSSIESSELTNTGYGSCVNRLGEVECDASVVLSTCESKKRVQISKVCMKGERGRFPVLSVTQDLVSQYCCQGNDDDEEVKLKLVKPVASVSVDDDGTSLVSEYMKEMYEKYCGMLNTSKKRKREEEEEECVQIGVSDTIGCIIYDRITQGIICGVSSGGSFLKKDGRIGCAGIVGSGCYILRTKEGDLICLMSSGNGEDIIQMDLCRYLSYFLINYKQKILDGEKQCCDLIVEGIEQASEEVVLHHEKEDGSRGVYVGVVGLVKLRNGNSDSDSIDTTIGVYAHSTESFVWGCAEENWEGDRSHVQTKHTAPMTTTKRTARTHTHVTASYTHIHVTAPTQQRLKGKSRWARGEFNFK